MNRLSEAEREDLGRRVMLAMICTHDGDEFGDKAVCVTCWENAQRVGRVVEAIVAARLASVEALADEWAAMSLAPLTDDQADGIRLRARSREAMYHWCARALRAVLGSDAHTEQKGTGE